MPMAVDPGIESGFQAADQQEAQRAHAAQQQTYLQQVLANTRATQQQAHDLDQMEVPRAGLHPQALMLTSPGSTPDTVRFPKSITNDVLKAHEAGQSRDTALAQQSAAADAVEGYHHQQGESVPPELVPYIAQARSRTPMSPKALETMQNYLDTKANAVEVTNADGTKDWVNSRTGKVIAAGRKLDPANLQFPGSPSPSVTPTPAAGPSAPATPPPLDPSIITKGRNLIAAANQETDPTRKAALLEEARKLVVGATPTTEQPAQPTGPLGRNGLPLRPDEHPYDPTKRLVPVWDNKLHAYRPTEQNKGPEEILSEIKRRRAAGLGNDPYESELVAAYDSHAEMSPTGMKEGGLQDKLDNDPRYRIQARPGIQSAPSVQSPGSSAPARTGGKGALSPNLDAAGVPASAQSSAPVQSGASRDYGTGSPKTHDILGIPLPADSTRRSPYAPPSNLGKLPDQEEQVLAGSDMGLDKVRQVQRLMTPAVEKELLGPGGYINRMVAAEHETPSLISRLTGKVTVPALGDLSPEASKVMTLLATTLPGYVTKGLGEGARPSVRLIDLGKDAYPNFNENHNRFFAALNGMESQFMTRRANVERLGASNHLAVRPYGDTPPVDKSAQSAPAAPLSDAEKRALQRYGSK
jgi:hypothetical protein